MAELEVRPVESRRQKKRFIEFPWKLYAGDPNWIPPLRSDEAAMAGYRPHPFYEENEAQTFLAYRGGEVCGRIAAIVNRQHIEYQKDERGFVGFFECRDDREASRALLDAAAGWLAERNLQKIRAQASPSMNYKIGTLIDGFDTPPTFMMPYNPPYYGEMFEEFGFRKTQDLYAFEGDVEMLPKIRVKTDPLAEKINERLGLTYRTLDRAHFLRDVEEFLTIFNGSLVGHWGFVPLTRSEVKYLAKGLSWLLVPEMAIGAEIDGKLIGVALALPDYNPRIKKIDGRLFPFGFFRLLYNKRKIRRYRLMAANVLPEYHLLGVGLALMGALLPKALEWGIQEGEFSWVAESNSLSRGALEKGGAQRTKTYRVYDLDP